MSTVILDDYTPIPHHEPWRSALLQEAPTAAGDWTQIDSYLLDPVDANPESPQARTFTSENATLDAGWYRIVWVDASSNTSATSARQYIAAGGVAYWPSVDDIAQWGFGRTYDANGGQGVFNDTTRPTRGQVYALIRAAASLMRLRIGDTPAQALIDPARHLIAIYVAMQIEANYYADEVAAGQSQYPILKQLYDDGVKAIVAARLELGDDQQPGTDDDTSVAGVPTLAPGPLSPLNRPLPGTENSWDATGRWCR